MPGKFAKKLSKIKMPSFSHVGAVAGVAALVLLLTALYVAIKKKNEGFVAVDKKRVERFTPPPPPACGGSVCSL